MSKRYIPQGAILVCNKGQKMTELKVTHNNNVTLYKGQYESSRRSFNKKWRDKILWS